MSTWARLCWLAVAMSFALSGADIEGLVVVNRKLTPRRVTAPANAYARGMAVPLRQEAPEDPLDFERSHVVIYLDGPLEPCNTVTAVLEQRGRQFEEDLLVVPAGSTVSFPNRDVIFHNVFSLSHARSFDLGSYPKDETRTVRFPVPGLVLVGCHLHPNMSAAIMVTPNRWAARADSDGHFRLSGMPPGRYTVVAWHKAAGYFRENVDLHNEQTVTVRFLVPLEATKGH